MARLFTAVELSPPVRAAVVDQQSAIAAAVRAAGDRDLRLVGPAQLHLTLVFIGDVPDERVGGLSAVLADDLALPPFDIDIGAPGVFPPHGPPRVLWLGIERGARELAQLHALLSARLESRGVPRESRPYQPHLTIGRWRDRGPARLRAALPPTVRPVSERVDHVTLFRSHLRPGAPEHIPLVHTRLA